MNRSTCLLGTCHRLFVVALVVIVAPLTRAQGVGVSGPSEALFDKMTGHWVLTGTIARQSTTHDVDVDWILKREYLRIHEVSREKDPGGVPEYEAWIYFAWDPKKGDYAVLWIDNTTPFNFAADGIARAKPAGDRIPMVFKDPDGSGIHTTFSYDRAKDVWSWTIDNVDKAGKQTSFGNLTMTRKK